MNETEIQQQYYAETAEHYDGMHSEPEHELALRLLAAYIELHNIQSILDVGAGTGRTVLWLKQRFPKLTIVGIEPVAALRSQGYAKGLSCQDLQDGDAYQLPFADRSFDLVCEFAVLHHIKDPNRAVQEMNRVAVRGVCISDCNFLGQGRLPIRLLKYLIFSLGLWRVSDWIKTKGKGYTLSEGDGLAYSYSIYQSLPMLHRSWQTLRLISTNGKGEYPWGQRLAATHLLVLALDKRL
jgi:ubiquinone/menaquinone biosynthesis C-methylase UbiE